MSFRIRGLAAEPFAHLFSLSADELAARHIVSRIADRPHAFPCRISLTDAQVGEPVLLLNYEHLAVETPYRASHAIYVREDERTFDAVDVVPDMLRRRLLSLRAFDSCGMMVDADVAEGRVLEADIERMLADGRVDFLHLHIARPGCYAARVERI